MALRLYVDLLSQPSRAVWLFLKANAVPFEEKRISLLRGQNRKAPFKDVSRFRKVPLLLHGDHFALSESEAIFRYVATQFPVHDHWLPKDAEKEARVSEYLSWHHLNLRAMNGLLFRQRIFGGKGLNHPKTVQRIDNLVPVLDTFEKEFISGGKFVNDLDKVSVADLQAVCELESPEEIGYPIFSLRLVLMYSLISIRLV